MSSATGKRPGQGADESPEDPGLPRIAERVLAYFRQNARAMDSVEGIARFWVREDPRVVERCLTDLTARGLLEKRIIAGTLFFSCAPTGAAPAAGGRSGGAPGRLLVVDDDPSVRRFLVDALTEAGHSVAAAENGARGVEIFRSDPSDVVLTDVMMPGLSGLEVLETIKRLRPATEVIVITAHASLDTAVRALREGAYDLITKPLPEIDALYRVVDRALEKGRLSEENLLLVSNLQARNIELTETVARLAAVNEIGKATTGLLDADDLYGSLVRLVAQHLKARRVSVLVSDPDSETMSLVASVGIPEDEGSRRSVRVGEGIAGRVAATQSPLLVENIEKTDLRALRTGGRYRTSSFMITPLTVSYPIRYRRRRVGVINVSDKHSGEPFNEQDLEFLSTLASQMAAAIENARLVEELEDGYLGALVGLIDAMEETRPESRGHSRRVATLSAAVARVLGLPQERINLLARAAALHELGRLSARPEEQDRAQGRLRFGGEWLPAAVLATERKLAPVASLRNVREIILRSADWFDAAAGPHGDDPPNVPVESRILATCEEFVTLTAGPDGSSAAGRAVAAIEKRRGRKHDPEVVAALVTVLERERSDDGGGA